MVVHLRPQFRTPYPGAVYRSSSSAIGDAMLCRWPNELNKRNIRFLPARSMAVDGSAAKSSASSGSPTTRRLHDETEYLLNHRDWLSPSHVVRIFENLRDPKSAISVWNQYSKRKDYMLNEAISAAVINRLAQAKNFDAIEDILRRIRVEKHGRLSDTFFYNVIKVCGQGGGRLKVAVETLLAMPKEYGCWPTVKTFNLVLNFLVSEKLFDVVGKVYAEAPLLGVEIDACCLNILIKGLCENGKLTAALNVLYEFPKQKCKPNTRTFSTLMHYLCEKGNVEQAFLLLKRMEEEGVAPDTITFNILISGLRKQGRVEEAMDVLEKMKMKGCKPNAGSYQEVVYGLLDAKKFMEAEELVEKMTCLPGATPSVVSFKKLIYGLCNRRLMGDAVRVLDQMVVHGYVPNMGTWRQLVGTLFPVHSSAFSNSSFSQIIST